MVGERQENERKYIILFHNKFCNIPQTAGLAIGSIPTSTVNPTAKAEGKENKVFTLCRTFLFCQSLTWWRIFPAHTLRLQYSISIIYVFYRDSTMVAIIVE